MKTIKQSSLRYRLKSLYDHGMKINDIKDLLDEYVDDFDSSAINEKGFISSKVVLNPSVIEDIAAALPTWSQLAKQSLKSLGVESASDAKLIEEFLNTRDISDYLDEFRGKYYEFMDKLINDYNLKDRAEAEDLLKETSTGKKLIEDASSWGSKYRNKTISYKDSIDTLEDLYDENTSNNALSELDKLIHGRRRGVRR